MIYTDVHKAKEETAKAVDNTKHQIEKVHTTLTQFEQSIEELARLLNQKVIANDGVSSMDNKRTR